MSKIWEKMAKISKIWEKMAKISKIWEKMAKISKIWEKMGKLMPVERLRGPNRNTMENYGDLQRIARNMKLTLWVLAEHLSFGVLPKQE